ncbi:MAG: hypothetical protein AB1553_12345 [Nitrospirota bacterium]
MRKKVLIIVVAIAIGLITSGGVFAWWGGMGYAPGTNVDNVKKFQKETLSLRDDLMVKQLELQTEYSKPTPDANRIAALEKEIIDLRTKIHSAATKHGLATGGYMGGQMGPMMGCNMMMGGGMMGHGMMTGPGNRGGYSCPACW